MSVVTLPVAFPPITSYPLIANIFSILWANKNDSLPWFADHYIQLHATWHKRWHNDRVTWFNFYDADFLNKIHPADYCPYLLTQSIDKTSFDKNKFCFIDFIESQINNGYYVVTHLNQFYLSSSRHHENKDYMHPTFIYGYDYNNKTVFVSDFYDNGKYVSKTVAYDEINQSYNFDHLSSNAPMEHYGITLYKYTPSRYQTNTTLLKQTLTDYVQGIDSTRRYFYSSQFQFANSKVDDSFYGINCYDMLNAHIDFNQNNETTLDIRPFHLLCDHKNSMKIRIEYLSFISVIANSEKVELLLLCENLIQQTVLFRNLALKCMIKNDKNILGTLHENCYALKKLDREFMMALLQVLL